MLNDSFSLHPNEGDTNQVIDSLHYQKQDSSDFVVIGKEDMIGSGFTTPVPVMSGQNTPMMQVHTTGDGRKETQGSGNGGD